MNRVKKYMVLFFSVFIFQVSFTQEKSAHSPKVCYLFAKDVRQIMDTSTCPLIINFWATWCGPCVRELEYFDSIIDAKKVAVKLLLVSLDFPESYPHALTAFVRKKGYKGEVVYLNESDADKFIPVIEPKWNGAIPASIFLNNAKKYYQLFNHQLTRERFALELEKLANAIEKIPKQ